MKPYNSCHFFYLPVAWVYYLITLRSTFRVTIIAYGMFVMVDLAWLVFTILVRIRSMSTGYGKLIDIQCLSCKFKQFPI